MDKRFVIAITVLAVFLLADQAWVIVPYPSATEGWRYIAITALNRGVWYVLLPIASLFFLYRGESLRAEIGLHRSVLTALVVAGLATSPMLLGYAWLADFRGSISLESFVLGCALAALGEEIYFRGYLFGQLHRRLGLWFLLAAAATALFFGLGHLYQSRNALEALGVFLITGAGGIWFSWLYKSWDYNLWVPVMFHFLMNFYWSFFSAGENALGGLDANLFRGMTLVLSVLFTLKKESLMSLLKLR